MSEGKLFIVSGPSGAGKSTVINAVLSRTENVLLAVSATTRDPGPNDVNGREYYFKTKSEFEELIAEGAFLEHAVYTGEYYGTLLSEVEGPRKRGINVILDIEVNGARQVREQIPEAVMIFLTPSSFSELESRIRTRGRDTEEKIKARLQTARAELTLVRNYDYLIVNDAIEVAVNELQSIIIAEKCRVCDKLELLKND